MDLVFASDCDIKFSVGKIKAKIMDFSLRGLLRVVFKPIINDMPLIGGVQVGKILLKITFLPYSKCNRAVLPLAFKNLLKYVMGRSRLIVHVVL